MDYLQRKTAEMAIKLLAMSREDVLADAHALDNLEQLATQVLKGVAALRAHKTYLPGEVSGCWRSAKTN